jgi:predicted  nucleic acid-binding Zn-ribbon protein
MKTKILLRSFTIGMLIGILIFPPLPAQAQWTVFDPTAYSQHIKSELKRAQEWAQKIQQYQHLYTNAVNQLTTLKGVLQTVDKQLAKNLKLACLTNDIGEIIRGSVKLHNQVRGMVKYQVAALQQIDDRLNNGIFDPEKDRADFEEYLLYSIGRNSNETTALIRRIENADAQLSKWKTERQDVALRLAQSQERLQKLRVRLKPTPCNFDTPSDPVMVADLNVSMQAEEARVDALKKQLSELDEKIQQRVNAHMARLEDMQNFGYQIEASLQMWKELQKTKDDLRDTMDSLIRTPITEGQ